MNTIEINALLNQMPAWKTAVVVSDDDPRSNLPGFIKRSEFVQKIDHEMQLLELLARREAKERADAARRIRRERLWRHCKNKQVKYN